MTRDEPDFVGLSKTAELSDGLPEPALERRDEFIELLNGHVACMHRLDCIRQLAGQGIVVYGEDGWRGVAKDVRALASHGDQLPRIYAGTRLNLDIPRMYQREIITIRVFDIAATRSVVLTESIRWRCRTGSVNRWKSRSCSMK